MLVLEFQRPLLQHTFEFNEDHDGAKNCDRKAPGFMDVKFHLGFMGLKIHVPHVWPTLMMSAQA